MSLSVVFPPKISLINLNKSASTSNNHNIKNIIIKGSSEIGYGTSS